MSGNGRNRAVVAVLAATAVLAPAAAVGGYAAGKELEQSRRPVALATSAPSPVAVPTPAGPAPSPTGRAVALSDEARALAAKATVRLSPPSGSYLGSGSIVSADGLVLTNAHVASPTAPGLAAVYGPTTVDEEDPDQLVVSVAEGDGPATPRYLADVVAVDGYLDLAVLRIVSTSTGEPLPAGTSFPAIPVGSVHEVRKGDDLTVYGFPALTGGDVLAVAPGAVRTFVRDRGGRVVGDRYEIETTADFSGGNSGGMALDNAGRLVGVPSARLTTEELAVGRFVRAVDLALPLLDAARSGTRYTSPYLIEPTGSEGGEDLGWTQDYDCTTPGTDSLAADDGAGLGRVRLDGLAPEQDVLLVLTREDRDDQVVRMHARSSGEDDHCVFLPLPSTQDGLGVPGDYLLRVLVGPGRQLVLMSSVTVS
jgi:S1-C subfamily serine protease